MVKIPKAWQTWSSPLGDLLLAADDQGLTDLHFLSGKYIPAWASDHVNSNAHSNDPVLQQTVVELQEYFAGKRKIFTVPLSLHGTTFQQSAWAALCQIPWGSIWSYGQQAKVMGQPNAVRAVGAANGRNPVAIIVPCHRVVGANGQLTGYAGGMENKAALLALEGLISLNLI
jgi:methylated-DNA-[protein]-cysteine S-methyltransferase